MIVGGSGGGDGSGGAVAGGPTALRGCRCQGLLLWNSVLNVGLRDKRNCDVMRRTRLSLRLLLSKVKCNSSTTVSRRQEARWQGRSTFPRDVARVSEDAGRSSRWAMAIGPLPPLSTAPHFEHLEELGRQF